MVDQILLFMNITTGTLFAVVMAIVIVIAVSMHRDGGDYDERQKLARGQAFRAGFITLVGYEAAYGMTQMLELRWCQDYVGTLTGVYLGMGVFLAMAAWKSAYVRLREKAGNWIVWLGVVLLFEVYGLVRDVRQGGLVRDGMLTDSWLNLLLVVEITVLLAVLTFRTIRARREERED